MNREEGRSGRGREGYAKSFSNAITSSSLIVEGSETEAAVRAGGDGDESTSSKSIS